MHWKTFIVCALLLSVTAVALFSVILNHIPVGVKYVSKIHAASSGTYYASGAQLFDSNGNPIVLVGANIESSFTYIKGWQSGKNPLLPYADPTFQVMSQDWHMNTLRLSISRAIYDLDKTTYMHDVAQVVTNANAHGLFVILTLHDDKKSGSLFPSATPTDLDISFWHDVVAQLKDHPMVGYDLFNEPHWLHAGAQPDWDEWLNGGTQTTDSNGTTAQEVGYNQLISAVRAMSPAQLIVVEPGDASGSGGSSEGGWSTFPAADILQSSNLLYSEHEYSGVAQGASVQNQKWGPLLGKYPIFYGEWAVLPNSYTAVQCSGMTPQNADQIAYSFMSYAQGAGAGWAAWAFDVPHMIADTTNFTPTQMGPTTSWNCPASPNAAIGMGQDVKDFLGTFKQPTLSSSQPPSTNPPASSPPPASGTQSSSNSTSTSTGKMTPSNPSATGSPSSTESGSSAGNRQQVQADSIVGLETQEGAISTTTLMHNAVVLIGAIVLFAGIAGGIVYFFLSGSYEAAGYRMRVRLQHLLFRLRKLK